MQLILISVYGSQNLTVYSNGHHYVKEHDEVIIQCTLDQHITTGSTLGIAKKSRSQFKELNTFSVSDNGTTYILNGNRSIVAFVEGNTFMFVFNASLNDTGIYRCFYREFPEEVTSNETKVFVQGKM